MLYKGKQGVGINIKNEQNELLFFILGTPLDALDANTAYGAIYRKELNYPDYFIAIDNFIISLYQVQLNQTVKNIMELGSRIGDKGETGNFSPVSLDFFNPYLENLKGNKGADGEKIVFDYEKNNNFNIFKENPYIDLSNGKNWNPISPSNDNDSLNHIINKSNYGLEICARSDQGQIYWTPPSEGAYYSFENMGLNEIRVQGREITIGNNCTLYCLVDSKVYKISNNHTFFCLKSNNDIYFSSLMDNSSDDGYRFAYSINGTKNEPGIYKKSLMTQRKIGGNWMEYWGGGWTHDWLTFTQYTYGDGQQKSIIEASVPNDFFTLNGLTTRDIFDTYQFERNGNSFGTYEYSRTSWGEDTPENRPTVTKKTTGIISINSCTEAAFEAACNEFIGGSDTFITFIRAQ